MRIYSIPRIPMKRRIRPIRHRMCIAMFDGIEMQVIHVRSEVAIITNQMLPKPMLPHRALLFLRATFSLKIVPKIFRTNRHRHFTFNQTPARRKISIAFR